GIVGRYGHARVVRLPAREIAVIAHHFPRGAPVLRAPQLPVVRRLPLHRSAVARLDERVHAIGVRLRDGEPDLADRVRGEAVALQSGPRRTAVAGDVNRAPRPTAL